MTSRSDAGEARLAAARHLGPAVVAAREEIERDRRLPPSLVEAMRAAGLFELWLPEAFGGPALHPIEFVKVIEALSRADGSAGWCATNGSVYSLLSGSLTQVAARQIFADRAIVAGSINPTGKAMVVEGGYRVSGRWGCGSGITHAAWIIANCVVHDQHGPRRSANGATDLASRRSRGAPGSGSPAPTPARPARAPSISSTRPPAAARSTRVVASIDASAMCMSPSNISD